MYSVICIFMAQLFRERTGIMLDGRSYLTKTGQSTPEESCQYGIDQLLLAMPIFNTLNEQLEADRKKGLAAASVSLVPSPRNENGSKGKVKSDPKRHAGMMDVEHAICCLETGWLYMMQVHIYLSSNA